MRGVGGLTLVLVLGLAGPGVAQERSWGATVGVSGTGWRASTRVAWHHQVAAPLRLDAGLRFTRFGGTARSYRSPEGPPGRVPRLRLAPEVWALNVVAGAELRLVGPLRAGANLDLVGVTAGPARDDQGVTVRPDRWSLFRYGDRDRGSLNSEFYLGLALSPALRLQAGISHYVTGYEARGSSARYLRFDTVRFLGVEWQP